VGGSGIECERKWVRVWEGVGLIVVGSGIECGREWVRVWEGVG